MKARVYMRVARDGNPWAKQRVKVDASVSPKPKPLVGAGGDLHTVHFALEVEIPDELLRPGDWPVVEVALDPELVTRVPIEVESVDA